MTIERRTFNRVAFSTSAFFSAKGKTVDCKIIDLSLKGALINAPQSLSLVSGESCELTIPLNGDENTINMTLVLTHINGSNLGLKCTHIDLDSITLLRRLVELNLGDSELLDREFEALCEASHQ